MNNILIFFVIPVVTIILAIILEKHICCPLQVAGIFFAIFFITVFTIDSSQLILVIAYTILAYVTAIITKIICNLINEQNENCGCNCTGNGICKNRCENNQNDNNRCGCNNQIRRVENAVQNLSDNVNQINNLLETIIPNQNENNNNNNSCCRCIYRRSRVR